MENVCNTPVKRVENVAAHPTIPQMNPKWQSSSVDARNINAQ